MGKINGANLKKAWHYMQKNGIKSMLTLAGERLQKHAYDDETYIPMTQEEIERQKIESDRYSTSFSILVPAYETPAQYFREMIASVVNQTYTNWELLIADAGSENAGLRKIADEFGDARIKYIKLSKNAGISENTNAILALAQNDYVALLDHDDLYTPDALFENAKLIEEFSKECGYRPGLIYSDEDKCDETGTKFYEVYHKPDFNLDLLLSNNYICHLLVMKREDMQKLAFRKKYDGSQDYDITIRQAMKSWPEFKDVCHIPKVLYHWRCHLASTAVNPESKRYAYEAGKAAVEDLISTMNWNATVEHSKHLGFFDINYSPDIFSVREDIGIIGGKVLNNKNVIIGGMMEEDGSLTFGGLKSNYSGYRNRAQIKQDAALLDIRCMKVRPELWDVFQAVTGIKYVENPETGFFDEKTIENDTDMMEFCTIISRKITKLGCKLLYDPSLAIKVKE